MSRSMHPGFFALTASLSVAVLVQDAVPTPAPTGPPALIVPTSLLVPEAVLKVGQPGDLAVSDEAIWISDLATNTLLRLDPATNKIAQTVDAQKKLCRGLAADFGAILVPQCAPGELIRVDPKTNALVEPIPTPLAPKASSIATGVGSVWVITDDEGTIARLDPVARVTVAEMYTPAGATSVVFGEGGLWVASPEGRVVTRINPYNNLIVESIPMATGPAALAVGEGAIWTWNMIDGSVTRIDPKTNAVVGTIPLVPTGGSDGRIVAGLGSVWVSSSNTPLTRIDPRTNRVAQVFTGDRGEFLALAGESVWLSRAPDLLWRLDPRRIEATRPGLAARSRP